jgi:23S rRNA pseudouridine1911/1915/1917 synthase
MLEPMVIYDDLKIIVVRKPPAYLAQSDGSGRPDILSWTKAYIKQKLAKPGNVFLGLCHRLDFSVGGVMVFAKNSKAAERVNAQFRERTVSKKYMALCEGEPEESEGELRDSLFRNNNKTRLAEPGEVGTEAILKYRLVKSGELGSSHKFSLLEIDLLTGFKHQIRAQLSLRGLPIFGDLRYGAGKAPNGAVSIGLFAHSLTILHPISRESLTFTAKPDENAWPWNLRKDLCVPL